MSPMNIHGQTKRRAYPKLGSFLKEARRRLRDDETGHIPNVIEIAKQLDVTPGFVYLVEKGDRKPKGGDFGKWASVYGVRYVDLWKCIDWIPFDLVATLREEPKPALADPFSQLTEEEISELLIFVDYVRGKIAQHTYETNSRKDN